MKVWERVTRNHFCGRCGLQLKRGDLALRWTIQGVKRDRWRCPECIGMPAPDLPPLMEPQAIIAEAMAHLSAPLPLERDWKIAQSGDREPGEDG